MTPGETVEAVFSAGINIECGSFTAGNGVKAYEDGYLKLSDLQFGLIQNYKVLMRLGLFDKPSEIPWANYGPDNVNTPQHQLIALNAAQQGTILLKNNNNALPILLDNNIKNIAIIGPNANNPTVQGGNYYGKAPFIITPLIAIQEYVNESGLNINVLYNEGICVNQSNINSMNLNISKQYAAESELTVFVMGLNLSIEAEGRDRYNLNLPGMQYQFISQVASVAKGKVILIIMSGGCVDISIYNTNGKDDNITDGILRTGYGGMYGGQGVIDIIFGKFAPTGLTTQTWYLNDYINEVSMFDMGIAPNDNKYNTNKLIPKNMTNPGRGYRYYNGKNILYPFGVGLSYTTFKCDNLRVDTDNNMMLQVDVTNTGNKYDSGAVILVYWIPTNNGTDIIPMKRLIAYNRIDMIKVGQTYKDLSMLIYEQFYW